MDAATAIAALRKTVALAALIFVADIPWLYGIQSWAGKVLKAVQGGLPVRMNWLAAIPVYIALGVLIQYASSPSSAALLGLSTYAVYDFTNLATLANYDANFAIADTLWGGALFFIVYTVASRLQLL